MVERAKDMALKALRIDNDKQYTYNGPIVHVSLIIFLIIYLVTIDKLAS